MFSFQIPFSIHQTIQPYLDPGTGSMIIQLVIATLLGAAILLRTFWKKIFRKKPKLGDTLDVPPADDVKGDDLPK